MRIDIWFLLGFRSLGVCIPCLAKVYMGHPIWHPNFHTYLNPYSLFIPVRPLPPSNSTCFSIASIAVSYTGLFTTGIFPHGLCPTASFIIADLDPCGRVPSIVIFDSLSRLISSAFVFIPSALRDFRPRRARRIFLPLSKTRARLIFLVTAYVFWPPYRITEQIKATYIHSTFVCNT